MWWVIHINKLGKFFMRQQFSMAWVLIVALAFVVGLNRSGSAEMISYSDLHAQAVVDSFNGMNGSTGLHFETLYGDSYSTIPSGNAMVVISNYGTYSNPSQPTPYEGINPNTSAYSTRGIAAPGEIASFGVTANFTVDKGETIGQLSYSDGKSWLAGGEKFLTLGAAYLYTMYATGELGSRDISTNAYVGTVIRYLLGETSTMDGWYMTKALAQYLQPMLELNNMDYWLTAYDPNIHYTEIGNYSVFVMNSLAPTSGQAGTDYLYVAHAAIPYDGSEPSTAPEPATMLMFGMGMLALPFARRLRKKHCQTA